MSRGRGTVRRKSEALFAAWKGRMMLLGGVAACFVISSPLSAASHAETPVERLRSLERTLGERLLARKNLQREMRIFSRELAAVKTRLMKAATVAREQGEILTQLEQRRTMLERQRAACHKAMDSLREQKARVLLAMERVSWRPLAVLTMAVLGTQQITKPVAAMRNNFLLRVKLKDLISLEGKKQAEMTAIETQHDTVAMKHHGMTLVKRAISDEHNRLHVLLRRTIVLQRLTESQSRATAHNILAISRETGSLRDLLAQLNGKKGLPENHQKSQAFSTPSTAVTQSGALQNNGRLACQARAAQSQDTNSTARPYCSVSVSKGPTDDSAHKTVAAATYRPFSQARGHLPMPTLGRVTTVYGQINDVGLASRGIVISARSGAQVVASYDGVVVFSGLLRGYGRLLIIEHGEGYHMVLAGMARIDAEMGQRLIVGEPVGVIENIIKPVLYVELRREGHPINPMPWLVACESGAKG